METSDADTSVQTAQTASADQQPQASQPQRSRTTVVCGECKRLKLRCDRQNPCASCLKRDTVQKCLYSAAAVEKLDIHSLNNRLTHIETFTTTYTNGRFQPAYASANNPSSQGVHTLPNYAYQSTQQYPGGAHHQYHHHAGVLNHNMLAETFSDAFQSLISTCLGDLGIAQNSSASTQFNVKPEPSTMNNAITFPERRSATFSNSRRMSKSQLRQLLRDHRTHAFTKLPPMTMYFSTTPSNLVSRVTQNSVPQVTSGLFSCLPPLATCERLLQSAGDIFHVRPLPFDPSYGSGHGWSGLERICLQFLSNTGKNGEEKKLGTVTKRARGNYLARPLEPGMGGNAGHTVNPPDNGDGGHHISLTFFAVTCAVLAIGAVSSPSEDDDRALGRSSAAFFYALSQQALGIWDTHVSSSSSKHSTTKGDAEKMEYLFACLLGIVYLLHSGLVAAASVDKVGDVQDEDTETGDELQDDDSQIVSSLVGKMVTIARNMQLNKEATWTKRKKKKCSARDRSHDDWKRMVWWEIVFYDLFIADALGQQPHISPSPCSTNLPSSAMFSKSEGEKSVSEDLLHSTDQDCGMQNAALASLPHDQQTTRITETQDEDPYFGARYQLAQVAQAVKSRSSMPDCCCGYTLDQAVALENQVREWQDRLPAVLKISGNDEMRSAISSSSHFEDPLKRLQAYELAIVSNVLVLHTYTPFLRMNGDDGIKARFMNLPAASACIHAAQAIVHLADGLQSLLSHLSISSSFPLNVMPVMFQFIPLEKLVFDAVVVCAHAAFAGKSPSMAFSTGMMAGDASLGLKVLRNLGPPLLSSVIESDGDDEFQQLVINILQVRLAQRSMRLKRKVDEEIADGDPQDFIQPGTGHHQTHQHDPPAQHHTFIMDSLSPQSTLESDYSGSQSPSSARQPSRSNKEPKNLDQEKGKKGKKGLKKHPAVGLRRRDANPVRVAPQSHPPSLAKAGVWKFEQHLMESALSTTSPSTDAQTMPVMSPIATTGGSFTGTGHRSRSSSASQVHPQPIDSSSRFGTPLAHSPDEMGMPPRKRLILQDFREQQLQPQPSPFASHVFDQGHRQAQQDIDYNQLLPSTTFDGQCPTRSMDPAGYRVTSSTQSPYMNAISVPGQTTPTYPHLPLSPTAQTTTYFSSPISYGPTYTEQLPSSNVIGLHTPVSGNSAPTVVDPQPPMVGTPVYDQSRQQPVENYSAHSQAHHMQNHPYHDLVSGQRQPSWYL